MAAITSLLNYKKDKRMDYFHYMIDWYKGFPFECATVDELNSSFITTGFESVKVKQISSLGCNEILFRIVK